MKRGEANTLSILGRAAACFLAAFGIGWVAFQLQQQATLPRFLFPLLFPLLVGGVTGFVVGMACSATLGPHKVLLTLVAISSGIVLVLAQTWFSYRFYVAEIDRQLRHKSIAIVAQNSPDMFSAVSFDRFIETQMQRSGGWLIVDAILTVASCTLVSVWLASNRGSTAITKLTDSQLEA